MTKFLLTTAAAFAMMSSVALADSSVTSSTTTTTAAPTVDSYSASKTQKSVDLDGNQTTKHESYSANADGSTSAKATSKSVAADGSTSVVHHEEHSSNTVVPLPETSSTTRTDTTTIR